MKDIARLTASDRYQRHMAAIDEYSQKDATAIDDAEPGHGAGVAKGVPGPRCPQLFAPFWSPWGPLGLVRGALDAAGASLELLGTPWARDTLSNTRPCVLLVGTPVGPRGGRRPLPSGTHFLSSSLVLTLFLLHGSS